LSRFFGRSLRELKLVWQPDGSSAVQLMPKENNNFFLRHWLEILVDTGSMSQFYLTQHWLRIARSSEYEVHWVMNWFTRLISAWTCDLASRLNVKGGHPMPSPMPCDFRQLDFRKMGWHVIRAFAVEKKEK